MSPKMENSFEEKKLSLTQRDELGILPVRVYAFRVQEHSDSIFN